MITNQISHNFRYCFALAHMGFTDFSAIYYSEKIKKTVKGCDRLFKTLNNIQTFIVLKIVTKIYKASTKYLNLEAFHVLINLWGG